MCANWLDLNLPDGSRDIVLCDGGLETQPYPQGQQQLVRIIRNVLSDQGLCIFRLYVLPPKRESLDAILGDMLWEEEFQIVQCWSCVWLWPCRKVPTKE